MKLMEKRIGRHFGFHFVEIDDLSVLRLVLQSAVDLIETFERKFARTRNLLIILGECSFPLFALLFTLKAKESFIGRLRIVGCQIGGDQKALATIGQLADHVQFLVRLIDQIKLHLIVVRI